MIFEVNLILSFIIFLLILYAGSIYFDNKQSAYIYRLGSITFKNQLRAFLFSVLAYLYFIASFWIWVESHWANSGIPWLYLFIIGLVFIPLEVRNMMKRKTTINPVVELMTSRIEFEFRQNSESTDKVESMIQSLVQEAQKSRDAEIAIERLTEREDQLGIISKSIVERECQNR